MHNLFSMCRANKGEITVCAFGLEVQVDLFPLEFCSFFFLFVMVGSFSFNPKEHLSLLSLFFPLSNTFSNIIVTLFFNLAHVGISHGLVAIP